jgi:hypothetical protein
LVPVEAQSRRCWRAPAARRGAKRGPPKSSSVRANASCALAMAARPRRSGRPAVVTSGSTAVSTRETKKLATEAMVQRRAAADPFLQAAQVCVRDVRVALDREEQGDVDIDAGRRGAPRGLDAGRGGGDLDHGVGPVDALPQVERRGDRAVGVVRERGGDLDTDEAIGSVGACEHRRERVGGGAHLLDRERVVGDLGRKSRERRKSRAVALGAEHGRAEDRGVRRQAGHVGRAHEALQLVRRHEAVEAGAGAERGQAVERGHWSRLLSADPKRALASATRRASAASALRPQVLGS